MKNDNIERKKKKKLAVFFLFFPPSDFCVHPYPGSSSVLRRTFKQRTAWRDDDILKAVRQSEGPSEECCGVNTGIPELLQQSSVQKNPQRKPNKRVRREIPGSCSTVWRSFGGHQHSQRVRNVRTGSYRGGRRFLEPVWLSGKALSWYDEGREFDSISALPSIQKLWFMDAVFFFFFSPLTITETLNGYHRCPSCY